MLPQFAQPLRGSRPACSPPRTGSTAMMEKANRRVAKVHFMVFSWARLNLEKMGKVGKSDSKNSPLPKRLVPSSIHGLVGWLDSSVGRAED
jgi:hypothetical protein